MTTEPQRDGRRHANKPGRRKSPDPDQKRAESIGTIVDIMLHIEKRKVVLPKRSDIHPGQRVQVVEKQNQRTDTLTEGVVARILTKSPSHPHGIKVMLEDGTVGRVKQIVDQGPADDVP